MGAGVDEPAEARKSMERRPGLAPQARERIARDLSSLSDSPWERSAPRRWRRLLSESLELGCGLAFPVTGAGLLVVGVLLLAGEVGYAGVRLAPSRPRLEVMGSAIVLGALGWLLIGVGWELRAIVRIRGPRFRLDIHPASLWRALAVVGGIMGILGWVTTLATAVLWPTLSLVGMLLLASGTAAVFAVAPVVGVVLWMLQKWWQSPGAAYLPPPLLLLTWAAGMGALFSWIWGWAFPR